MLNKTILLLSLCCLLGNASSAATDKTKDSRKEAERALSAANVVAELMNTPESNIPTELMDRAHAIAVIPNVVKAAFGVGGRHGKGVVARRINNRTWGTPSFIDISGGSLGLQLGVSVTDLILVFTNEDGLKGLFEDKLELGGSAGVAAGPVGRSAEVGSNLTFDSPIYSYSRSKGLFAGISLKGTVMTIDDSANHDVYGANVSGRDILLTGNVPAVPAVKPFLAALNRAAPQQASAANRKDEMKEDEQTSSVSKATAKKSSSSLMTKADVKQVQESLQAKGYYHGSIDGIIGPKTRNAIREYQKAENLSVNGDLDSQTAAKLGGRT